MTGRFINMGSKRCDCGAQPAEAHRLTCHPDDRKYVVDYDDEVTTEQMEFAHLDMASWPRKNI